MAAKRQVKGEGGIYERKDGRWPRQHVVETPTEAKRYYGYAKMSAIALLWIFLRRHKGVPEVSETSRRWPKAGRNFIKLTH
jgi:hypothetical protein